MSFDGQLSALEISEHNVACIDKKIIHWGEGCLRRQLSELEHLLCKPEDPNSNTQHTQKNPGTVMCGHNASIGGQPERSLHLSVHWFCLTKPSRF